MKKYDIALALASKRDNSKLALARMMIDMMERRELYETLDYDNSFERLGDLGDEKYFELLGIDVEKRIKNLEKEFELKNYDVALALAAASRIEEARKVMDSVNPKKGLDIEDFRDLEKSQLQKAEEIKNTKDLHDRLFKWLKEKNLPQPEIPREDKYYLREITAGWKALDIECNPEYEKYAENILRRLSGEAKRTFKKVVDLNLVDRDWFNKLLRRDLSRRYGFMLPGLLKFIDYVCIIGESVWVIEGKGKLTYEAIGQVVVYSELLIKDNSTFSKVKKAIVCEETDPLLEGVCKTNDIEVFVFP